MSLNDYCYVCENKDHGLLLKCEGCSHTFCVEHTNQHRSNIQDQLKEIMAERKNIFDQFVGSRQQSVSLFDEIDQWEQESILKIKQVAQDARIEAQRLADEENDSKNNKFQQLSRQLQNVMDNNQSFEKDLYQLKISLEKYKYESEDLSPSIIVYQNSNESLVDKIFISKKDDKSILNETLLSYSNEIQFDEKHHIAMHCGPYKNAAYVIGKNDYLTGRHKIRFYISKKTNEFILSFNIISKLMDLSTIQSDSKYLTYGWQSDDYVNPSHYVLSDEQNFQDLKGKINFHIEFFLDCDRHRISYFNEETKRTKEIYVDMEKCPLPWKLFFYFYDVEDTIRLLSSSK